MTFSNTILLALLPALAVAVNDWSIPCTSGACSYDAGDGINTAWSSLVLNALSTESISDITSAAGWEILNCDSKSTDPQDIRLVCVDQTKGCSQLFEGGADDTIVRLPESCAGGPFARVSKNWIDKDQNLPARLAKRGQTTGQVRGLALDFDFAKIPESRGKIYMTVAGTNSPAQRDVIRSSVMKRSLQPLRHANRRDQAAAVIRDFASPPIKRSPFSIGDAFNKVKDGIGKAVDTVGKGAQAVGDAIGKTGKAVGDGVGKVVDAAKTGQVGKIVDAATGAVVDFVDAAGDATHFDKNFSKFFDPIVVDKNIPIIDQTVDCGSRTGSVSGNFKIDATLHANVTAHIGFIVTGSVVPINIDKLAFTGGLVGNADATFDISVNAQGTLTTPTVRIFEIGLPGLDFPGILSIGPSFSVNAFAEADLDVVADLSLGASLDLSQMQFAFPASAGTGSADIKPKDSPLKLNVGGGDLAMTANFTAHLIPRIDIGVTILGGSGKATVFADVDASARLDLSLKGRTTGKQADGTAAKTDFGGNVGMTLGVAVNVGAEAALQPFFNKGANLQLLQKSFPLFSKDFGTLPPVQPEADPAAKDPAAEDPAAADPAAEDPAAEDPAAVDPAAEDPAAADPAAAPADEVDPTAPVDPAAEDPAAAPADEVDPVAPAPAPAKAAPTKAAPAKAAPAKAAPAKAAPAKAAPAKAAPEKVKPVPVNPKPIPVKRSVLPGRHSKRALSCATTAAKGALTSLINAVAAAPK